jgi:predicted nucleotidyltransferase
MGADLAVAKRHGARLLLQFGSTVTDKTHARSDLDLAVLFEKAPAGEGLDALLAELRTAFPGQTLDLGILNPPIRSS